MALDFVVVEGAKVLWLYYLIPNAVQPDAQEAHDIIVQILDEMCTDTMKSDNALSVGAQTLVSMVFRSL